MNKMQHNTATQHNAPHNQRTSLPDILHEVSTQVVALFIALAFSLMAEAVKESIKHNYQEPLTKNEPISLVNLYETVCFAITFFCIALSYFLGTYTYLGIIRSRGSYGEEWLEDFAATVLTLTLISLLGVAASHEWDVFFLLLLAGKCAIQVIRQARRGNPCRQAGCENKLFCWWFKSNLGLLIFALFVCPGVYLVLGFRQPISLIAAFILLALHIWKLIKDSDLIYQVWKGTPDKEPAA